MKKENSPDIPHTEPTPGLSWARRRSFWIALAALIVIQLCLTFYFERPHVVFSNQPNAWLDFDTHIEQTYGVVDALDQFGKAWSYQSKLLAGFPHGTIFDADNKGWELLTFGLWKLGMPKGMAFNMYILLAHLMVPWIAFFAARLFGQNRQTALLAATMALSLWFFDAYPRWIWWVGMTAYGIAGYFFLLPLALFYRYLKDHKWRHLALLTVCLSIGHVNHPYIFVILVFPMLVLYIRRFKQLPIRHHMGFLTCALITIAVNSYWLITALRFWHYILNSAFYCQSTISYLFTDYLGMLKEPLVTGVIGSTTAFRFLFIIAAIIGLYYWRRESDDRFLCFTTGIVAMLGLAYLGGYNLAFSQIQPYRHAMPAMYFSIIPAAAFFERLWRSDSLRKLPRLFYAIGAIGLVVVIPGLARDMLYYFPDHIPISTFPQPEDEMALKRTNHDIDGVVGPHMDFRHEKTFEDFDDVVKWLNENDKQDGRILVEWWILGEHLSWRTESHILGGFLERNLDHAAANVFRREYDDGPLSHMELEKFFTDYAVKWVLTSHPDLDFIERNKDLLEPVGHIPPVHRLYATKVKVSFFAENHGEIDSSMNRIAVTNTDPDKDVVLRFHWMDMLVCSEGCSLSRETIEGDPVGFIRIAAPHPADFTIVNAYEYP
jgi:hypothetical protein